MRELADTSVAVVLLTLGWGAALWGVLGVLSSAPLGRTAPVGAVTGALAGPVGLGALALLAPSAATPVGRAVATARPATVHGGWLEAPDPEEGPSGPPAARLPDSGTGSRWLAGGPGVVAVATLGCLLLPWLVIRPVDTVVGGLGVDTPLLLAVTLGGAIASALAAVALLQRLRAWPIAVTAALSTWWAWSGSVVVACAAGADRVAVHLTTLLAGRHGLGVHVEAATGTWWAIGTGTVGLVWSAVAAARLHRLRTGGGR